MININNKNWGDLSFEDIKCCLISSEIENFFFEFKEDEISTGGLIKEISAFANTYGGYIFLGVDDNKNIVGCHQWNEQRIHATIHDSLTPVPKFQVRCFVDEVTMFVIRIEEGNMPPYITNKGQIFERVSSGSFPINESSKLAQLYHKSEVALQRVKNKIELPLINSNGNFPNNFCGYLDLGFSVTLSEPSEFQKNFYNIDLNRITGYLRSMRTVFSVSRVGLSYMFCIGRISVKDHNDKEILANSGMNTFVEITNDGSVKSRIILNADSGSKVNIALLLVIYDAFKTIYEELIGKDFADIFISAYKYEQLSIIKQFEPYIKLGKADSKRNKIIAEEYVKAHREKYGDNLIITGNRIPSNDYYIIDRQTIDQLWGSYNIDNLMNELFYTNYFNLGFIDELNYVTEDEEIGLL